MLNIKKLLSNSTGFGAPVLLVIVVVGLLAYFIVSSVGPFQNSFFAALNPKSNSQAASYDPATRTFLDTFGDGSAPKNADGTFAPHAPANWSDEHWYVTNTGSEDHPGNGELFFNDMEAEHGTDCNKPPATHHIDGSINTALFLCRDHMMTAFNSGGDGYIDLIPDHLFDISQGTATIRFDVSTARHSDRDWIEFHLSPMGNSLPLAGVSGNYGFNTVRLKQTHQNNNFCFTAEYIDQSGNSTPLEVRNGDIWTCMGSMATSSEKRTTFEIRISKTHFWFGIKGGQTDINAKPINNGQDFAFADKDVSIPWNNGVFMIGHGSYNPFKDEDECFGGVCGPNTWHWDNVSISPAIPFTLIKGDKPRFGPNTGKGDTVTFPKAAPANSFLKYTTYRNPQISFNGGATWSAAAQVPHWTDGGGNDCSIDPDCYMGAFYTLIPAGTTQVKFRTKPGQGDDWIVKDAAIWSTTAPQGNIPTPLPTSVSSSAPTAAPTQAPTAGPTAVPTLAPTAAPVPAGGQTITFDNASGQDRILTGQYPTGVVDWGTSSNWWLSAPHRQFSTKSLSFSSSSVPAATFAFLSPTKLVSLQANNVAGSGTGTVTLSCSGNPNVVRTLAVGEVATITTNWANTCTNVTITSSNAWDTNFDNIVIGPASGGPAPTVAPTQAPTAAPTTPASTGMFRGEYFNNRNLNGTPTLVRDDQLVQFNWGKNKPVSNINADLFSVRWTKTAQFEAGTYVFTERADDGLRVYIDNQLVYNRWSDQAARTRTFTRNLTAGNHTIKVEYYENRGEAVAEFSWVKR